MPYQSTAYKVFIASPGDVKEERSIVREVLAEWNDINSEKRALVLLPIGWDTHSTPEMGSPAQEIINKRVLKTADILIGVFWTKVGTPTDRYPSGTIEEIEEHIKASKPTLLYFSSAPVRLDSVDHNQYDKLQVFKESCKPRGLFQSYDSIDDFRTKFNRHIGLELNKARYATTDEGGPVMVGPKRIALPGISNEALELLIAVTKDPSGQLVRFSAMNGVFIQANGRQFTEDENPRSRALWEDAIRELEDAGLIESVGYKREIFQATHKGYEVAEKLA